jgi:hypothetical protein
VTARNRQSWKSPNAHDFSQGGNCWSCVRETNKTCGGRERIRFAGKDIVTLSLKTATLCRTATYPPLICPVCKSAG